MKPAGIPSTYCTEIPASTGPWSAAAAGSTAPETAARMSDPAAR